MAKETHQIIIEVTDKGSLKVSTAQVDKLNSSINKTTGSTAKSAKEMNIQKRNLEGVGKASLNTSKSFAKQSQGLGGLVHAYATVAANIFALSAAFLALKRAGNFGILIKGQEEYTKITGVNLNIVARRLQQATKGVISFREASKSAGLGISAGLTQTALVDLAKGADSVAKLLGREVPDAFDRLVRGVVKGEPEILDELGIFIRLDNVYKEFAATLNKTSAELSESEKLSARNIAVQTQLTEKYSDLGDAIDSNSFEQLASAFSDILDVGLSVVAGVLNPFAQFLTKSPEAVAGLIAIIAKLLLSKIIPTLGAFAQKFADNAQMASRSFKRLGKEMRKAKNDYVKLIATDPILMEKNIKNKLRALPRLTSAIQNAMKAGFTDPSLNKLAQKSINAAADRALKNIAKGQPSVQGMFAGVGKGEIKETTKQFNDFAKSVGKSSKIMSILEGRMKAFALGVTGARRVVQFTSLQVSRLANQVLADYSQKNIGFFTALRKTIGGVGKIALTTGKQTTLMGRAFIFATASMSGFKAVSTLVGIGLLNIVGVIGTIISVIAILSLAFSYVSDKIGATTEKSAAFSEAAESLKDNIKKLSIGLKSIQESFSNTTPENLAKRFAILGNALGQIEAELVSVRTAYTEALKDPGWWSGLQQYFGFMPGAISDTTDSFKAMKEEINRTGITTIEADEILKKYNGDWERITKNSKDYLALQTSLINTITKVGKAQRDLSSSTKALGESIANTNKELQTFYREFETTTALDTFATEFDKVIKSLGGFEKGTGDVFATLPKLKELLSSTGGSAFLEGFGGGKAQFEELIAGADAYARSIEALDSGVLSLKNKLTSLQEQEAPIRLGGEDNAALAKRTEEFKNIPQQVKSIEGRIVSMTGAIDTAKKGAGSFLEEFITKLTQANETTKKAQAAIRSLKTEIAAYSEVLSGISAKSKFSFDLQQKIAEKEIAVIKAKRANGKLTISDQLQEALIRSKIIGEEERSLILTNQRNAITGKTLTTTEQISLANQALNITIKQGIDVLKEQRKIIGKTLTHNGIRHA